MNPLIPDSRARKHPPKHPCEIKILLSTQTTRSGTPVPHSPLLARSLVEQSLHQTGKWSSDARIFPLACRHIHPDFCENLRRDFRDYPETTSGDHHEVAPRPSDSHVLVLFPYTPRHRNSPCKHLFPPEKSILSKATHREASRALTMPVLRKTPERMRYLLSILQRRTVPKMCEMQRGDVSGAEYL